MHLCLLPEACEHTHPARTFPDKRAMACEPACGKELKDRIPGCKVPRGPVLLTVVSLQ